MSSAEIHNLPKRFKDLSFGNYIIEDNDEDKFTVVKEIRKYNFKDSIILLGKPGVGKTHLSIALLKFCPLVNYREKNYATGRLEYLDTKKTAKCLFLPIIDFMFELNDLVAKNQSKRELIEEYLDYDCICLDDLGSEKYTDASRQNLYYFIDRCYREMKPLIINSNLTIEEINDLEPRIASRLVEMGKIIQINGEDYRLKLGG